MIRFLFVPFACGFLFLTSCRGPRAVFEVSGENHNAPVTVHFVNTSKGGETFLWDCGNGANPNGEKSSCDFLQSGRYSVKLKAITDKDTSVYSKDIIINAPEECLIVMVTNFGKMVIRLLDETPLHRDHFINLVESGFYEGISFHRLIPGFVIQGGDPSTKRSEPLKSEFDIPPVPAEFHQNHFHTRGAVAAARMNEDVNPKKESSPTQFYIVQGRQVTEEQLSIFAAQKNIYYNPEISEKYRTLGGCPQLDMEYTVFGEVIEGLNIIDEMSKVSTDAGDKPKTEILIQKMIVVK